MKNIDWYRRPEMILAEIIDRTGRDVSDRVNYRAVVLAVDLQGGLLQNPDGAGDVRVPLRDGSTRTYRALVGPMNPRGAVKARVLTDGLDRLLDDQQVRVFWPMFPQDLSGTPATPGEHVYVTFEGVGKDHGIWISRVSGHESANSFNGTDSYTAPSAPQTAMDVFESNMPLYPTSDEHAGLAPPVIATTLFKDD